MRNLCLGLIVLFFIVTGCKEKQPETLAEYRSWFGKAENGYVKEKAIGGLVFTVQYRPIELEILNELEEGASYSQQYIDSLKRRYEGSNYFVMEIRVKDPEGAGEGVLYRSEEFMNNFNQTVEKLSFGMGERFFLEVESDTIYPSVYHFERGFELGERQRFVLGFPDKKKKGPITFVYNDDLFHASILKFQFETEKLEQLALPKYIIK
jgi:hypothetical protein